MNVSKAAPLELTSKTMAYCSATEMGRSAWPADGWNDLRDIAV